MTDDLLKVPPHSLDAEQSVIGGILIDETDSAWDRVADVVSADDFYRSDHRVIFRALASLADKSQPLDIVVLGSALENAGELDNVGGLMYLAELANKTPSSANVRRYAEIVRDRALLRSAISVGHQIADMAFNPSGKSGSEVLSDAQRMIADVEVRRDSDLTDVRTILKSSLEQIDRRYQSKSKLVGRSTGYIDIDRRTQGIEDGNLIIIAGRPSMGKTTMAMNIAENISLAGENVFVFSLEMTKESLLSRSLSSVGRIPHHKVRSGQLEGDEWDKLRAAATKISDAPLWIDDTGGITTGELRAKARRMARSEGAPALIVVDYIQLMTGDKSEGRTQEVTGISMDLKSIAKEFACPVIAISQLNRSLESRSDKRPIMSDLRESGAIEQDADVIIGMYRDEVYHENTTYKGIAESIFLKQRNGEIGTEYLASRLVYQRFDDYAGQDVRNLRPTKTRADLDFVT